MSVSYTHLDVYKRQSLLFIALGTSFPNNGSCTILNEKTKEMESITQLVNEINKGR